MYTLFLIIVVLIGIVSCIAVSTMLTKFIMFILDIWY